MASSGTGKKAAPSWSDRRVLDEAAQRQFGYSLLRRAYIDTPNNEYIEAIQENDLLAAIPYQSATDLVASGVKRIADDFQKDGGMTEERILSLGDDHMQLFVGPGKLPAAPWEAIYVSEKRMVFQASTIAVRRAYEQYQLQPERFKREPDDHIALELDFMARLCELFAAAIRGKKYSEAKNILDSQIQFLENHLGKWVPDFCADIRDNAWSEFNKGMADILEGYINEETKYCDTLMTALKSKVASEKASSGDDEPVAAATSKSKAGSKKG